jgi:aspartate aminotransferase
MITPGGKPALYYSILANTIPGSSWLIPKPYWVSYPDMIKLTHGFPIFLEPIDNNWLFDIQDVKKHFEKESVNGIILCNPNNPTGLVYPEIFLNKIIELATFFNKKIIIDEVYLPLLSADNYDYKSSLFFKNQANIISIWSFSKGWGIPGCRLGFILASKDMINKFGGIQSTVNTCPSTSSQEIATQLLKDNWLPTKEFKKLQKYKTIITDLFIKYGWILSINPMTSMYLFPVNEKINIDIFVKNLLDKGLAIMPGEPFGIKNGVRLTLFNDKTIMNSYINILKSYLSDN